MSEHPLTDEILGRQFDGIETSSFHQTPPASIHDYLTVEQSQWLFDEQDMRLAYDMGAQAGREEQLNTCESYMHGLLNLLYFAKKISEKEIHPLLAEYKEEMRLAARQEKA